MLIKVLASISNADSGKRSAGSYPQTGMQSAIEWYLPNLARSGAERVSGVLADITKNPILYSQGLMGLKALDTTKQQQKQIDL